MDIQAKIKEAVDKCLIEIKARTEQSANNTQQLIGAAEGVRFAAEAISAALLAPVGEAAPAEVTGG